jgi:hypothetical protein
LQPQVDSAFVHKTFVIGTSAGQPIIMANAIQADGLRAGDRRAAGGLVTLLLYTVSMRIGTPQTD